MSPILGCIADDVTGATDIASALALEGLNVVQILGLPTEKISTSADAIVISLKIRSCPVEQAVNEALNSIFWLQQQGIQQYYFKYCSTFDSTDSGNIIPITETLLTFINSNFTVICPALPVNKRTVYQGYLFVGDKLLSESPMRHHPITPMQESNLCVAANRQSTQKSTAGLIDYNTVQQGSIEIRKQLQFLQNKGHRFAVIDAINNDNLQQIAIACGHLPLLTGSSALAQGLAQHYRQTGLIASDTTIKALPKIESPVAVLAGSCSEATRQQIQIASSHYPVISLKPEAIASNSIKSTNIAQSAWNQRHDSPVIIFSTSQPPQHVSDAQNSFGKELISETIETFFASLAIQLVNLGIRKLIIAGGETSGAIAQALTINHLRIGPTIDPGIPWTITTQPAPLLLAFKSGNFGSDDFIKKAVEMVL